jgi:HNH endonuclease
MATRSLSLQWVEGDADKAETSFFKINTQGTPLDNAEETLLRNRRRSIAIAARSIVRAGTGHKYWSKFSDVSRSEIEKASKKLHAIFFNPEVNQPIKTLDLPLGGTRSPLQALDMLMKLISLTNAEQNQVRKPLVDFAIDSDGSETQRVLNECAKVASRLTGTGPGSLGLHPAVYFYTDNGRHLPDLLLGFLLLCRRHLQNNNMNFFKKFSNSREKIEAFLISNKGIITQALNSVRSNIRVERSADLFQFLVDTCESNEELTDAGVVGAVSPNSMAKILTVVHKNQSEKFTDEAKSAIFIRQSLAASLRCPVCKGYLDPTKSASYDHVQRVQDGGTGESENGQLTHPYCNSAIKN